MNEELERALDEVEKELSELPTRPRKVIKRKRKKTMPKKLKEVEEETKPVRRKKRKAKSTAKKVSKKPKAEAIPKGEGYTAAELADEFGCSPSDLRRALRTIDAKKPGPSWVWPKKTDAGLKSIRSELKAYFKDIETKKVGRPKKGAVKGKGQVKGKTASKKKAKAKAKRSRKKS